MRLARCVLTIALLCACDAPRDLAPPKAIANTANRYVGVQRCGECHDAAFAFWNNTRHARAFFTLANKNKQGDPACIGCHVTGYGEPSGHAGAQPRGLEAVQCEVCHGMGARHAETQSLASIVKVPDRALCRSCHRPPQVREGWDLEAAWQRTLGPGHGQAP